MTKDHRQDYHRVWNLLTPPLRPNADVIAAVKRALGGVSGRTLLLGVTPELADIMPELVAVDRNAPMIENLWPGDTASRRAVLGEWQHLDFPTGTFSACVGDGCLCSLKYPDELLACLREVVRVLRQGGTFVCRIYAAPDRPETATGLRDAALAGTVGNFHAFKFRLGMMLAAQQPQPQIVVDSVLNAFNAMFADREQLARATGWPREQIDTIDFYRGSTVVHCFPTRDRLRSLIAGMFEDIRFAPTGDYELAERCPLLIATTR